MIKTSEQIDALSDSLVKAQAKFGAAIKSSQNPAFRSKYADLTSIIDATLEHLNAEGITVMQHPALEYKGEGDSREAMITVTTRLQHKSGQFMESELSIPAIQRDRFDAQSCGSAMTYACRYALQSICCVPREDDDANSAAGVGSKEAAHNVAQGKLKEYAKQGNKTAQKALESQEQPISEGAALFFAWEDASQTATVMGDEALKSANRDLLKPLYRGEVKAIVATADQLEDLKYQFDQRKVPFLQAKTVKK